MTLEHSKTVVLIFIQTRQFMWKVQNEIHLYIKVIYDFHCPDFHETLSYSNIIWGSCTLKFTQTGE